MATMDAQQIYENFRGSVARGTDGLEQAQQTSYELAQRYQTDAFAAQKLINDIASAWTGQAAEAASQGLAPMAENLLATSDDLNIHQDLVYRQAHSYHRAASQVAPVPPAPSMADVASVASSALITGNVDLVSQAESMYNQVQARNAVGQANVDAYHNYVQSSIYNSANLPTMSNTLSTTGSAAVSVGTGPSVSGTAVGAGQATVARPLSARSAHPGRQAGGAEGALAASGGIASTAAHGGPASASPTTTSGVTSGASIGAVSPARGGGSAAPTGPGGTVVDPLAGGAGPTFPITGDTPGVGAKIGGGDPIDEPPMGGGDTPAAPRLTGAGADQSGGRGGPVGARSTSILPDDEVRGGGAHPTGASAGSADDMAMSDEHAGGGTPAEPIEAAALGAGRGKAGDAEHKRSVPLSADPEVFDATGPVAPPVLGETAEQYQQRPARDAQQRR